MVHGFRFPGLASGLKVQGVGCRIGSGLVFKIEDVRLSVLGLKGLGFTV